MAAAVATDLIADALTARREQLVSAAVEGYAERIASYREAGPALLAEARVGELEVVELDRRAAGMGGRASGEDVGEIGHGRQAMAAPTTVHGALRPNFAALLCVPNTIQPWPLQWRPT